MGAVKAFWIYTGARFGIFAVLYAVIVGAYLVIHGGGPIPVFWPLIVAAIGSAVLSAYFLKDLRENLAQHVQSRAERMSQKFEEMRAKEDTD